MVLILACLAQILPPPPPPPPPNIFGEVYLCQQLLIVTRFYPMQFIGKLKKPNFRPNCGLFGPNLGPRFFFVGSISTRCWKLSQAIIVCNYKDLNFKEPMIQVHENAKKTSLVPDLGRWFQIWGTNSFFLLISGSVSY